MCTTIVVDGKKFITMTIQKKFVIAIISTNSKNVIRFLYFNILFALMLFLLVNTIHSTESNNNEPTCKKNTDNKSIDINECNNITIENDHRTINTDNNNDDDDECQYYMAESAIPFGGLGVFTTIDIKKGDIAQSLIDICIYVANAPNDDRTFDTHAWGDETYLGQYESDNSMAICEGFASLFNTMPSINNYRTSDVFIESIPIQTNAGLHRDYEPGSGSISHYYGIYSKAMRNIEAGSELTISYADFQYNTSSNRPLVKPMRSIEWLRTYGMCIDNIEIKLATDRNMGRGAFTKRYISKDSIVVPAPLQLYPNRSIFNQQIPEALFINYCYHLGNNNNNNTMLLYPYGPGVNLINHGNSITNKANVKLEWSKHYMNHNAWLTLPLDQLINVYYPGAFILDVIALHDIDVGEELFLDYGIDWENAWNEHLQTWKPIINNDNTSSYMYVEEIDRTQRHRTIKEQMLEPYASNLKHVCWVPKWDDEDDNNSLKVKWTKPKYEYPVGVVYCNILSREKVLNNNNNEEDGHIQQQYDNYEYVVSLNFDPLHPDEIYVDDDNEILYVYTNVPQSAISFVDKPYRSDLHLTNAFRHPISLSQNLIPNNWSLSQQSS